MRIRIAILMALALMAGCSTEQRPDGTIIPTDMTPHILMDFKLEDGTRCVFAKQGYAGGIQCDFIGGRK